MKTAGLAAWLALIAPSLVSCSDPLDPGRKPSDGALATRFALVVTDSLDQGLGGAFVTGTAWSGTSPVQLVLLETSFRADSLGRAVLVWPTTDPVVYDSITIDVPARECRPYATNHFMFSASSLQDLKGDSLTARLPVGLAMAPPILTVGAKACAGAEKEFGGYRLWLAIDAWPATGDSVRAQWEIIFRETSGLAADGAAGVVRSDSLLMKLKIDAPSRCAPGFLLRARLDAGRLGEAALEPLDQSDPLCASLVKPIHELRFVPLEVDWWP